MICVMLTVSNTLVWMLSSSFVVWNNMMLVNHCSSILVLELTNTCGYTIAWSTGSQHHATSKCHGWETVHWESQFHSPVSFFWDDVAPLEIATWNLALGLALYAMVLCTFIRKPCTGYSVSHTVGCQSIAHPKLRTNIVRHTQYWHVLLVNN